MEQRFKIHQLISLVVLLFFITGCMSAKLKPVQAYPVWFSQRLHDSASYYYAVAEGKNKNDATANALNQIASKISVSIESKFESNTVIDNNKYNKYAQIDVSSQVGKIHFNNYAIVNEQQLAQHYFVFLKVNKIELANALQSEINSDFTNTSNKLKMRYKNNVLKLRNYTKVLHSLHALKKKVYIFSSIKKQANIKVYLAKLSNIKNTISKFRDSVTFHIQGSKSKYVKVLYDVITQKGYKINKYKGLVTLSISINKNMIHSLGYKIIKAVVVLRVVGKKDASILGEKRLILGGKSISSFAQADEFMLSSFRKKLENKKILSGLLGI